MYNVCVTYVYIYIYIYTCCRRLMISLRRPAPCLPSSTAAATGLWTWEFHPSNLKILLEPNPLKSRIFQLSLLIITSDLETNKVEPRSYLIVPC